MVTMLVVIFQDGHIAWHFAMRVTMKVIPSNEVVTLVVVVNRQQGTFMVSVGWYDTTTRVDHIGGHSIVNRDTLLQSHTMATR